MKKVLQFLRSMRFGVLLMIAIALLCVLATALEIDLYQSWYFIALFALLCLNLLLCSALRVKGMGAQKKGLLLRAGNSELSVSVPADRQSTWLKKHRFCQVEEGRYLRCGAGMWGSFVTHIALLLLLVAAVLNFTLTEKNYYNILPGSEEILSDGTVLHVDSFKLKDETGSTMYDSSLSATLPDGTQLSAETRVNAPAHIGRYKVYQQNYGNTGIIGLKTEADSKEILVNADLEMKKLDFAQGEEPNIFLSLDGQNGISYYGMFTNVITDENGGAAVAYSDEIINPAYQVDVISDGQLTQTGIVFPGETLTSSGVTFSMHDPATYSGLLVKAQPAWTLWVLYLSFALMIPGLYLCFFHIPVAACPDGKGSIRLAGRKDISDWVEDMKLNDDDNSKE